jgi:hypothetical protein
MGHDLPRELYDTFVDAIRRVASRAGRVGAAARGER